MGLVTNQVKCGGYLVKKSIILGKKDTGMEWAMVDLTLSVGKNEEVSLSMFANKLTSTGNENKSYKSIMTIKDEYMSLESLLTDKVRQGKDAKPQKMEATTVDKLEECDFVYANKGITLSMNRYMREGELSENFRLSTRFINRAKDTDSKEPYIEGNLIGVVSERAVELEDGDKTYVKMQLTVPEYREAYGDREESVHVDKFDLVLRTDDSDAIDYCVDTFEENVVASIGVRPIIKIVTEQPKEEVKTKRGFGKVPTFEPSTKVVREIEMIGGYDLEEDEYAEDKAFDLTLYSKGLEVFDKTIEDLKSGANKETVVTRGFGKSSKSQSTDLPF